MPRLLFVLCISLFTASCNMLYHPNVVQTPMLQKEGDAEVNVGTGFQGAGLVNAQMAYSPRKGLAFMANGMYHYHPYDQRTDLQYVNVFSTEVGVGYYKRIEGERARIFQCYGGAGLGFSETVLSSDSRTYTLARSNYATYFLQPGWCVEEKKLGFGTFVRTKLVREYNVRGSLIMRDEDEKPYPSTAWTFGSIEPTFNLYNATGRFRFVYQIGFNLPIYNPDGFQWAMPSSKILMKQAIGLTFLFSTKREVEQVRLN